MPTLRFAMATLSEEKKKAKNDYLVPTLPIYKLILNGGQASQEA